MADQDYDYDYVPRRVRTPLIIGLSIVLLRLAVGWHFYREGTKKLAVDPATGKVSVAFSGTEWFLRGAVGPVAELAKSQLPGFHDWEELLAKPHQYEPPTSESRQQRAKWLAEYTKRRETVEKKNETLAEIDEPLKPISIEFPPDAPYHDFAERISADWLATHNQFTDLGSLTEEQRARAAAEYQAHKQELADYFETIEPEIVEWQHELWRLQRWQSQQGAGDIPFEETRIAEKEASTRSTALPWIAELRSLEQDYFGALRSIVADEDAETEYLIDNVDSIVADGKVKRLRYMDVAVTCLTIGVGVCLMLGLFTRLASLFGAGFLLAVMATQPPWVEGAVTEYFYYQLVEFAALMVLIAVAAGRYAGLDFFLHSLLSKGGEPKEA